MLREGTGVGFEIFTKVFLLDELPIMECGNGVEWSGMGIEELGLDRT